MKKTLSIIGLVFGLVLSIQCQTVTPSGPFSNSPPTTGSIDLPSTNTPPIFSGPLYDVIDFLGRGSNWMIAPFGTISTDGKLYGGGLGVGYKLSDFVVPAMRLDVFQYDQKSWQAWMPSMNMQLQVPILIMGKFTFIPLTYGGVGIPIAGTGLQNGEVVGIFGAGGAIRVKDHWDLIASWEKWTNIDKNQIRFGVVYKF